MGLTCLWRRRQIARFLLTSRPIDDDPGLKRHLERCGGCSEALRDYECFDNALQCEHVIALSPDFNTKLTARLAAASASPDRQVSDRPGEWTRAGAWTAAALACLGGIVLWTCATKKSSVAVRKESDNERTVWLKPPPKHNTWYDLNHDSGNGQTLTVDRGSAKKTGPRREPQIIVHHLRRHRHNLQAHMMNRYLSRRDHRQQATPADLQDAGAAVGAKELFISLVTSPWRDTADAYAQMGDEPGARDAYAKEYETDGNVEAAIRAGEYSRASGDPAAELQYCALALTTNP